jgi:hypothetical protein
VLFEFDFKMAGEPIELSDDSPRLSLFAISPSSLVIVVILAHMVSTLVLRGIGVHSQKKVLLQSCLRMDAALFFALFVQSIINVCQSSQIE